MESTKSGIYQIKSRATGRIYIGLSVDAPCRGRKHLEMLRGKRHFNIYLQRHFEKYGESDLEFSIIEYCQENELESREIYWIEKLLAKYDQNGFNLSEGGKLKNYTAKLYSFEHIETGQVFENISVRDFAKFLGITERSGIYGVVHGKNKTTHGWKLKGKVITPHQYRKEILKTRKGIKVKNITTGETREFNWQLDAAKSLDVHRGTISKLFKGVTSSCNGWILLENEGKVILRKNTLYFHVEHPEKGEYKGFIQQDFCEKFGVSPTMASQLINGNVKQTKGWTLKEAKGVDELPSTPDFLRRAS